MLVAVRCDGDARLGAGHVGRCLPIAHALRRSGCEVVLVGHFAATARALVEASGLPVTQDRGAAASADALVLDVPDVPAAAVAAAVAGRPAVVLGDPSPPPGVLAVRYDAVAGMDTEPEPGADAAAATGATRPDGSALLGPAYAPVDPRLAAARRPRTGRRALVTLGGAGDPGLRRALTAAARGAGLEPDVPAGAPGLLAHVEAADVGVCGAGVTAYELACAGVAAVVLEAAEDQRGTARALERAGSALAATPATAAAALARLADPEARAPLAAAGPALVDGLGAVRVRDALLAACAGRARPRVLRLRPATTDDAAALLAWRADPQTRRASRDTGDVSAAEHGRWLARALADPGLVLHVLVDADGAACGTTRLDLAADRAELSITIAPGHRGRGLAAQALRHTAELALASRPHLTAVVAALRADNERSARAFVAAGFRLAAAAEPGWLAAELTGADLARDV